MAIDPRKRQKKLERRQKKQKAERRALARASAGGVPARLHEAAAAPIVHCCMSDELRHSGIGEVLISRQLKNGEVAFVVFLVDRYCLGVKNVIMQVAPRAVYQRKMYDRLAERSKLISLRPECARKFVEGAVAYALDLGLSPYPDYRTGQLIFGDVRAEDCTEEYVYGKDGKPFFIAGPYDDAARCEMILRALEEACGPDGYHYLMPVDGMSEFLLERAEDVEDVDA